MVELIAARSAAAPGGRWRRRSRRSGLGSTRICRRLASCRRLRTSLRAAAAGRFGHCRRSRHDDGGRFARPYRRLSAAGRRRLRLDPLARCLQAALEASDAADLLGLDSEALAGRARDAGVRRVGFPGDAYVLALVGGTGVGKSSLLNALAGGVVSTSIAARDRRPRSRSPGFRARSARRSSRCSNGSASRRPASTTRRGWDPVAILDLPDMDSVASDHRARVEALLPLVDAVAWVTDPEKYADAVLHDDFLRSWLPRLGRQVVLVNKSDRLAANDARRVQRDLKADLASEVIRGSEVVVLSTSAMSEGGTDEFRAWLAAGAEAKRVVRERIGASLAAAARDLAWAAGEGRASARSPLLDDASRAAAVRSATDAVLRVVDLPALEGQAVGATRATARSRGAGPLGRVTSFVYRTSGRETAVADPGRFLLRWRERGGLGPAVEAIRDGDLGSDPDAPPAIRPALAATLEPAEVRVGLERALDRAIGGVGALQPPTSRWWTVFGLLQTLTTAAIVLSVGVGRRLDPRAAGDGVGRAPAARPGSLPLRGAARVAARRLSCREAARRPRRVGRVALGRPGPGPCGEGGRGGGPGASVQPARRAGRGACSAGESVADIERSCPAM